MKERLNVHDREKGTSTQCSVVLKVIKSMPWGTLYLILQKISGNYQNVPNKYKLGTGRAEMETGRVVTQLWATAQSKKVQNIR